jgi:FAD/FMN-containing dehydrogenase/Fe-S oxidoreductase
VLALRSDFQADLARRFSGELRFDPYSRVLYSTDASLYQIEPLGVAFPRNTEDVQCAVEVCAKHGVPLIARGGGSGLAGQAIGRGLILDCARHLNRVEINSDEGWALVEPGVICDALNRAARAHGLMFGCEPSSSNRATLAGMIANNATGAHSILHGMTGDQMLAADVILADGAAATLSADSSPPALVSAVGEVAQRYAEAIRAHYPRTWRRASGYALNYLLPPHGFSATRPPGWQGDYPNAGPTHLHKLLAGSEGTLAVITRAKLRLTPRPKHTGLALLQFESIAHAADAAPALLESRPAAIELIGRMILDLTRSVPAYARMLSFVVGQPAAILAVEFQGGTEAEVLAQIEALEARRLAPVTTRALTPVEQANVWGVRKAGLGLAMSVRGDAKPAAFMEDVAAPVGHLGEFIREIERIFADEGVSAAWYGHASAGCLHIRPVLNLKAQADVERMRRIASAVLSLVQRLGGAMSGEHGDGLSRSVWNERLFGPEIYQAFREIKRLFDPQNLLNPGKVIAAQDLSENLRYGSHYEAIELRTDFDFSREGGFAGAVEQCNGAAVCRQDNGGMCPSFHATREEEHSTRGRANALRAALSGVLPPTALTSERMYQVLDLCLECKACKAECPSAVDMAKIKYEFLAQYQARHGVPMRSRLFANIAMVSKVLCPVSGVANALLSLRAVRWLNEKLLGVSRHRVLPKFAPRTFRRQFEAHSPLPTGRSSGGPGVRENSQVVLFADTFTNYNQPSIGLAAVRVLRAAGYSPVLAPHICCGRPMISKGRLEQARDHARRNVEALAPYAERGLPIIGLEPSCLLTLRDEYLDLLPHDPRAQLIAQRAVLIEEFISARASEFAPINSNLQSPILFHGHCYQKALTGTAPLRAMLALSGADVREIDSGCCGMAGSFGYEAEHYALSMQIGEGRLFPAVRASDPNSILAASGFSCRHQIEAGTGRTTVHPIEVLAMAANPAHNLHWHP